MLPHADDCMFHLCSTFCLIRRAKAALVARMDIPSSPEDAASARAELTSMVGQYGALDTHTRTHTNGGK
jgi:hypothetical protein